MFDVGHRLHVGLKSRRESPDRFCPFSAFRPQVMSRRHNAPVCPSGASRGTLGWPAVTRGRRYRKQSPTTQQAEFPPRLPFSVFFGLLCSCPVGFPRTQLPDPGDERRETGLREVHLQHLLLITVSDRRSCHCPLSFAGYPSSKLNVALHIKSLILADLKYFHRSERSCAV